MLWRVLLALAVLAVTVIVWLQNFSVAGIMADSAGIATLYLEIIAVMLTLLVLLLLGWLLGTGLEARRRR